MKAFRWTGRNEVALEDVGEPLLTNQDDVKVRVGSVGVCTTDFHIIEGCFGDYAPLTMGHEIAGVVTETGSGVTGLEAGQPVALQPTFFCGDCDTCRRGLMHLCPNRGFSGLNRNGGFAEFMVAPAVNWIPVSSEVGHDRACLAEPLACVLHALDILDPSSGDSLCLAGAGISAYLFVEALKAAGWPPESLLVSGLRDAPLHVISDRVDSTVNDRTLDLRLAVHDHFGPSGPDVFIDMTGSRDVIDTGLEVLARRGILFLYAYMPNAEMFNFGRMQLAENTVLTSTGAPDTMPRAAEYIQKGVVDLDPMVTHQREADEFEDAFRYAQANHGDHVKTVVGF